MSLGREPGRITASRTQPPTSMGWPPQARMTSSTRRTSGGSGMTIRSVSSGIGWLLGREGRFPFYALTVRIAKYCTVLFRVNTPADLRRTAERSPHRLARPLGGLPSRLRVRPRTPPPPPQRPHRQLERDHGRAERRGLHRQQHVPAGPPGPPDPPQ